MYPASISPWKASEFDTTAETSAMLMKISKLICASRQRLPWPDLWPCLNGIRQKPKSSLQTNCRLYRCFQTKNSSVKTAAYHAITTCRPIQHWKCVFQASCQWLCFVDSWLIYLMPKKLMIPPPQIKTAKIGWSPQCLSLLWHPSHFLQSRPNGGPISSSGL